MATIRDVANKAGVSIGVVSRAFNNYPDINVKTRQRVFEVAKELNYSPNLAAKNLSSKKQTAIGLIASGIFTENKKDTVSYDIFKGVYTAVEETGYELSIYFIDSLKQEQKSYVQFCRERKIGGTILQGIRTDDSYFKEMMDTNIPCVLVDIGTELDNRLIGSVSIDNFSATREAALYLLNRNHRDIVVVAGTEETYVNYERFEGTRNAFQTFDLQLTDNDIIHADFSEEKAYAMTKTYLERKQPSAFLCYSDLMAYGVMRAVKEAGLQIPEDVSIIGFDDLIISDYTHPRLTTVRQDFMEIGRQSAKLLQKLMENNETERHVYVPHQFMDRNSVKTLPPYDVSNQSS
ncbi:LacI family DNA-binding transcriptional regulator [Evansella tamaricis]|uniref:LacI family transcriptional regulator n=1 Tax=Evansella tamaricis TaxID=2069301 RepID=A0ABS6JIJ2_9BACI|nr:LacI family DNA-binding transcriptional regulator [Evansella tamaricis]MBU9712672.1 LacI family transcriptional regulator [Evansella tamaricis]